MTSSGYARATTKQLTNFYVTNKGNHMQATKEIQERFLLTVSREEAEWLKGLVQNPPGNLCDEDEQNAEMRSRYFHAIDRVLKTKPKAEARNIAADTGKV